MIVFLRQTGRDIWMTKWQNDFVLQAVHNQTQTENKRLWSHKGCWKCLLLFCNKSISHLSLNLISSCPQLEHTYTCDPHANPNFLTFSRRLLQKDTITLAPLPCGSRYRLLEANTGEYWTPRHVYTQTHTHPQSNITHLLIWIICAPAACQAVESTLISIWRAAEKEMGSHTKKNLATSPFWHQQ